LFRARQFAIARPCRRAKRGEVATMGFSPGVINLDISDIAHPKLIGMLQMTPPFISAGPQSEHSVLPLWDRKLRYNGPDQPKPMAK
jgi:hypothetical protein